MDVFNFLLLLLVESVFLHVRTADLRLPKFGRWLLVELRKDL